ncbi:hypothetical protein ODS41_03730 [Pyrobaculum sp. 3827-6]|uniref:hypothetical protein n=1 Tax=Pyrobaculum sp. 3827-6 TaxID=2983604 RepID=UPI0021D905CE|nr:hypothetical protein [Pyrobaculum sp. 3827-6]MCU7787038.1 hypothetical protein [Pyrobaculum sp. 3827-6]
MWITDGLYADYYLVAARTGPREARHRAITLFLLPRSKCIEASPIEVMRSGVREPQSLSSATAELATTMSWAG